MNLTQEALIEPVYQYFLCHIIGPRGKLQLGAPEIMQARHQACSPAQAPTGVRGYPQGGLLQIPHQPKEGPEACRQEVVLRSNQGIRIGLNTTHNTTTTKSHLDPRCSPENANIIFACNTIYISSRVI